MPLYYFDIRDGPSFIEDDRGNELANVDEAKKLAAASIAELAREYLPGSVARTLVITVRNDKQEHVFEAKLTFKVVY